MIWTKTLKCSCGKKPWKIAAVINNSVYYNWLLWLLVSILCSTGNHWLFLVIKGGYRGGPRGLGPPLFFEILCYLYRLLRKIKKYLHVYSWHVGKCLNHPFLNFLDLPLVITFFGSFLMETSLVYKQLMWFFISTNSDHTFASLRDYHILWLVAFLYRHLSQPRHLRANHVHEHTNQEGLYIWK